MASISMKEDGDKEDPPVVVLESDGECLEQFLRWSLFWFGALRFVVLCLMLWMTFRNI